MRGVIVLVGGRQVEVRGPLNQYSVNRVLSNNVDPLVNGFGQIYLTVEYI